MEISCCSCQLKVSFYLGKMSNIRPGINTEEIYFAAEAVYRDFGVKSGYRTGHSIGCSFLETPEFKLVHCQLYFVW